MLSGIVAWTDSHLGWWLVSHQQRLSESECSCHGGNYFHARSDWSFNLESSFLPVVVAGSSTSQVSHSEIIYLLSLRASLVSWPLSSSYEHLILYKTALMIGVQLLQVMLSKFSLVFRGTGACLPLDPWITFPFHAFGTTAV